MTLEKELRTMSWLAVGQLIKVTIVKDQEGNLLLMLIAVFVL